MNDKNDDDSPIYLDYDVNELQPIISISHIEKLGAIKGYFEKSGFLETGETYKGFTIFENVKKRNKKILNELFKKRSGKNDL